MDWIDYRLPEHNFKHPEIISYKKRNPFLERIRERRRNRRRRIGMAGVSAGFTASMFPWVGEEVPNIAQLMESEASQLLREQTNDLRFPILRTPPAGLLANDLIPVVTPQLPEGLIFYMDFTYGETHYNQHDYKFNIDWILPKPPEFSFVD